MSSFEDLDPEWLRARPGIKWHRMPPDVLPAWVADMDFPTAEPVRAALRALVDGADLGYPDWTDGSPLRAAFADRMTARFGWAPDPSRVREVVDVAGGVQRTLRLVTGDGDAVAVHVPCYPPFLRTVTGFDRQLLPIPMRETAAGWSFDPAALDRDLAASRCRALLLVNPQNPTGRVFTRDELTELATLARRHDLLVIADEIHADLTYPPHMHIPFASLGADAAARTVTLTSATKAFGLAGVRTAVAHLGPSRLLTAWDAQPPNLHGVVNVFGVTATLAAWTAGDGWLAELLAHLDRQRRLLAELLADQLPAVRWRPPQAGYLAWLDCRALGLGADPAAALLSRARVCLSPGPDFGPGGQGFARLNFATSAALLREIVDRMATTLR